ncbi:MAG: molecular chaperone TorD family protein [Rhodocyclaceae bacterium]
MNDMTIPDQTPTTVRTEMWLTLARAFQAPTSPALAGALLNLLADDLADFSVEAGFPAAEELTALRDAAKRIGSATALLIQFSRLFLSPPMPAHLNIGVYLDGAVNGPALDAMEVWRARYGIAQRETVLGLPDQLPVQLEFIAYLASHDDEEALSEYVSSFLAPALPRLVAALDEAGFADTFYRALLAYTQQSIAPLTQHATQDVRAERRKHRHDINIGVWRHCDQCNKPYAREKEIQIMTKALTEAGLPADHLAVCPDCRSPAHGGLPQPAK